MKLKMKERISFFSLTCLGEKMFNQLFILIMFKSFQVGKENELCKKGCASSRYCLFTIECNFKCSINCAWPKTEDIPVTYGGGLLIFTGFPLVVAVVLKPKFEMI